MEWGRGWVRAGGCGRLRPGGRGRAPGACTRSLVPGGPGPVLGLPTRFHKQLPHQQAAPRLEVAHVARALLVAASRRPRAEAAGRIQHEAHIGSRQTSRSVVAAEALGADEVDRSVVVEHEPGGRRGCLHAVARHAAAAQDRRDVAVVLDRDGCVRVPRIVSAMILLQWHTGMRPNEVVQIRTADVDRSGTVWVYRPPRHKNAYRGHCRRWRGSAELRRSGCNCTATRRMWRRLLDLAMEGKALTRAGPSVSDKAKEPFVNGARNDSLNPLIAANCSCMSGRRRCSASSKRVGRISRDGN